MRKLVMLMVLFSISFVSFGQRTTTKLPKSEVEKKMEAMGLIDLQSVDSTIEVYLVYATPNNFMGRQLYQGISRAYLLPEAAQKLALANKYLREKVPDLHLIVYDAARPISVQYQMWDMVKGTSMSDYVANPIKGNGLHNYAAAVDVTLVDCTGMPLQMGSTYDFFGDRARTDIEEQLLIDGKITKREYDNRNLLRDVMVMAGFRKITSEWWHFNLVSASEAKERFKIVQ